MKNKIFKILSLLVVSLIVFTSCNSAAEKKENKEDGIVVGNITEGNQTTAKLTISLDVAAELMQKHNRLTEDIFNYEYTQARIEAIQTDQNKFTYFLAVKANLEGKNNESVYSYYSIFTELSRVDKELHYYSNAFQQSCLGKCCNNCKLIFLGKNNFDCECETTLDNSDCSGKGKCKKNSSRVLDEEQEKDDMI